MARVAKTLDMIWPGARVETVHRPDTFSLQITIKTKVDRIEVLTARHVGYRDFADFGEGFYEYLMEELPRYHCSSIVEAAIRAAAKGRYNSHGDLREGFQ